MHHIAGPQVPEATRDGLLNLTGSMDKYALTAVDFAVRASKSSIISLALWRGQLSAEDAVAATRLTENFQTERWGVVEGGHDLDEANLAIKLAASSVFLRLLEQK